MQKYSIAWNQQYLPEKNSETILWMNSKFTGGKKFCDQWRALNDPFDKVYQ